MRELPSKSPPLGSIGIIMMDSSIIKLGLVGARGYVGAELVSLISQHPIFKLKFASSRALEGQKLGDHFDGYFDNMIFENLSPAEVATKDIDIFILALPNNLSGPFIEEIEKFSPQSTIIDLSGDNRFRDDWTYGLPELNRINLLSATRVSNPGCYATGMQVGLAPLKKFITGTPHCFGVSGYSGAGTTPSRKNDLKALENNLMPYAQTGHLHEKEVSHYLGRPVYFLPHVSSHFRGISLTLSLELNEPLSREAIISKFKNQYEAEPLIEVIGDIPEVKDIQNQHGIYIGGFSLDESGTHLVINVVIDNLLKGAATQAIQNMNLVSDLDEFEGLFN